VLSKVMALELSPWLFAAMHQSTFVDLEKWINERAWVVLRLPSGEWARGCKTYSWRRLQRFRRGLSQSHDTQAGPYYFVIDEAQEIGAGMRLESMLSEGAKFGARVFVLAQSLSMMRSVEGFEPVVQALSGKYFHAGFFLARPGRCHPDQGYA